MTKYIVITAITLIALAYNTCQTQASINRSNNIIKELHASYEWLENNGVTVND
jgi:hypothetical protein